MVDVTRLSNNPIVETSSRLGSIVNHPSLIEVPSWVDDPLGNYYLYFSHKYGDYIRLAYADELSGEWTIYDPGTLHVEDTPFVGHIASPDAHVDHDREVIRLYYHGETRVRDLIAGDGFDRPYRSDHYHYSPWWMPYHVAFETGRRVFNRFERARRSSGATDGGSVQTTDIEPPEGGNSSQFSKDEPSKLKNVLRKLVPIPPAVQETRYAESRDGISFGESSRILGPSWMAVFEYDGGVFGLGRDGFLYVSDGVSESFTRERQLFDDHRHFGVHVTGNRLEVYYSRPKDRPEHIVRTQIELSSHVDEWEVDDPVTVLHPEMDYEGTDVEIEQSQDRTPSQRRRELRDPDIYVDEGEKYLCYAAGGESAIVIASLGE